jgi:hypothetical protein
LMFITLYDNANMGVTARRFDKTSLINITKNSQ